MPQVINLRTLNPRITIAAANSTSRAKRRANYVCTGTSDQVLIQSAIALLAAEGGGQVTLEEGDYNTTATIQITSGNMKFHGRSKDTRIKPVWNNASPLDYALKIFGTTSVDRSNDIYNVSISDLSIIGGANWSESIAAGGSDPDGVIGVLYGEIFYQFVSNLRIKNTYGTRVGFVHDVRNCYNVYMQNIEGYQCSGPTALVRVDQLSILGAYGNDVKSVVDLGEVHNATITNLRGIGTTVTSGQHEKGFDCGGCTNIVLSDFKLTGFDYGVNLKYETLQTKGLTISNGQIIDSANPLRLDMSGVSSGAKLGPTLLNNIIIKNGGGVGMYLVGYSDDTVISNCKIESVVGIQADGTDNTVIHDCVINATAGCGIKAGKLDLGLESNNLLIHHNIITSVGTAAGREAIWVNQARNPKIVDNTILGSGYHGIWVTACLAPTISRNRVLSAYANGIYAQWANTTYTDATNRLLGLRCEQNTIKGWYNSGSGAAGHAKAIGIDLTGISGAAFGGALINANSIVGTGAESGIDLNSPVDMNFQIKDNDFANLSVHKIYRRGSGVLGASAQVRDNHGHVTENSGTATVASGSTSIAVSHGLASNTNTAAPTAKDVFVTPTNNLGSATKFWVTSVGATQFTINVDVAPGGSGATFAWQVQKLFGV